MIIAIASRNGTDVSGHIGKCATWIIFESLPNSSDQSVIVKEIDRIRLPKRFIFHHYRDQETHPLSHCHAVIGKSAGNSFIEKMKKRGIEAIMTSESSPEQAAKDYVRDNLAAPHRRPIGEIICRLHDALSSD